MKIHFLIPVLCLLAGPCLGAGSTNGEPRLVDLRCEHLHNPLGIDMLTPRLSWRMDTQKRGAKQTAYRILVAGSLEKLNEHTGDLWDSGKVESDQSHIIPYAGTPLRSEMPCFWKVMVWDQEGNPSGWSPPAHWSMGLLDEKDPSSPEGFAAAGWEAEWIGLDSHPNSKNADTRYGERKTKSARDTSKEEWHKYISAEIK